MVPTIAAVSALGPLNSATVLVALPALAAALKVAPAAATWVVSVYLVAVAVLVGFAGPVADRLGRRRVVVAALAGLGLTSVLAAASTSLGELVVARLLQAVCTSMTVPAGMALVREHVPAARRTRAFGTVAAATNASGVIAPLVGALMVQLGGWRDIFIVNIPLAVVVIAAALLVLPADRPRSAEAAQPAWVPRFDLFGRRNVAIASSSAFFHTLALYSALIILPFAFAGHAVLGGIGPAALLVAMTAGLVVGGPVGGRAAARFGRSRTASTALLAGAAGLAVAALGVPPPWLLLPLALAGFGLGAGLPPLQAATVDAVDRDAAAAAASLFMVGRNTGALLGAFGVGLALASRAPSLAYRPVMLGLAASLVAAATVATALRLAPGGVDSFEGAVMLPEPAAGEVR